MKQIRSWWQGFGKKGQPDFVDPILGDLWEEGDGLLGTVNFPPLQKQVELLLPENDAQSLAFYRQFWTAIQTDYPNIESMAKEAILERFQHFKVVDSFPDFREQFALESISFPSEADDEWSLSYYEQRWVHHWFTLEIKDGEVRWVAIDG
ncbi:hypothetical protein [Lewinella sp. 4G2]|uniref:hypothetical protein n=1 Tax=Lewinella sp. 4G2 TaxID=1803372 RepID=UPI0012FCBBEC|nr:hypothetical protein [Lewinella sp. 4G2]